MSQECIERHIPIKEYLDLDLKYSRRQSHIHAHIHTHINHTHTHTLSLSLTHTHTHMAKVALCNLTKVKKKRTKWRKKCGQGWEEGRRNRKEERETEKFITRQPPIGEKDDHDSENSWISGGLLSSSRKKSKGEGKGEGGWGRKKASASEIDVGVDGAKRRRMRRRWKKLGRGEKRMWIGKGICPKCRGWRTRNWCGRSLLRWTRARGGRARAPVWRRGRKAGGEVGRMPSSKRVGVKKGGGSERLKGKTEEEGLSRGESGVWRMPSLSGALGEFALSEDFFF